MESTDAVFAAFEMTFNGGLRDHDHQPYYSGRRRRRGMNVQIVADAAGRPVWASAAPPGCAHDLTAARTRGTWKILTKLRCSPSRTTAMAQAILVLHHVETRPTKEETLSHADRP
jgi:hypothetical protein